jgi:formylglycine-generating enzyme required for sulfatase activity
MQAMPIRIFLLLFILVLIYPSTLQAATEQRIALVIGNGAYNSSPLKNPVNDATDLAAALKRTGFSVTLKKNANLQEMVESIEDFGNSLKRGGVGLFYYAGHGVQVSSVNYLLPVNARINKESDVRFQAVDAGRILAEMENANNGLNIVILDACRDNPFGKSFRSASRGLAIVANAPSGTFISYSTGAGQVARDGDGRNSPYTSALLENIAKPGLTINKVFMNVRSKVKKETGQVPWELSSLEGDFYFARGSMVVEEPPAQPAVREPATGKLTVKSNVGGAKVYIDSAYEGEEPVSATLKPGAYSIILKKAGYPDAAENVRIEAGEAKTISIVMEKPAPPPVAATKTGDVFRDAATGMEFVFVKGGCYEMGDTFGDGKADEKPVHNVCVNDLYLGKYEVTVGQFKRFVNETGYRTDGEKNTGGKNGCWAVDLDDKEKNWNWRDWASWKKPNKYQDNRDDHPVSCVSWNDTKAFTDWLTRKSGKSFRLPTEAEWEYAARGGNATRNYWGNNKDDACSYANVADRSKLPDGSSWEPKHECTDGYTFVSSGGKFQPNAFGLYDMMGNVWGWCQDWYGEKYYGESSKDNPRGPSSGQYRVLRGGAWNSGPENGRAANRNWDGPATRADIFGFRVSFSAP